MTESLPELDPEVAGTLVAELPPAVVADIVETFGHDFGRLLRQMREAAASGDAEGYAEAAHALAGAAGSIGARALEAGARAAMRPAPLSPAVPERLAEQARMAMAALTALAAARAA